MQGGRCLSERLIFSPVRSEGGIGELEKEKDVKRGVGLLEGYFSTGTHSSPKKSALSERHCLKLYSISPSILRSSGGKVINGGFKTKAMNGGVRKLIQTTLNNTNGGMKRKRSGPDETMDIVWQTPANAPHRHDYICRDGVRYVKPYYFEFISHAKNRWAGKTIVDLFADEFKGRPRDYYFYVRKLYANLSNLFKVSAVKTGRIQVDDQKVPISHVVRPSQKISHFLHRHEPPVKAMDVQILHSEPDVVTVYKPATIPVHPCGQYRKNTIVGVLQAEHDLAPLFPIHRLDRLVSGLLIIARTASKADTFRQQIESGEVKKQYIARVTGVFPQDKQVAKVNVNYNAREGRSTTEEENGSSEKNSVKGKTACTQFTRISTDGTQSIVLCEPITGRTHQIRVHLQYLGHPIANDFLYLSESVPLRSFEGVNADRAATNSGLPLKLNCETNECGSTHEPVEDFDTDPMCTNCPNLPPKGYNEQEPGLWLHCIQYSGPDWTYKCPYPDWASLS